MKSRTLLPVLIVLLTVLSLATVFFIATNAKAQAADGQKSSLLSDEQVSSLQVDVSTAFTYQGSLKDGDDPADGDYDFEFKLFDSDTGGAQVGSTVSKDDVVVINSLFTLALDFGDIFDGTALWLEVGVRPGSSTGVYTTLSPRQALSVTPFSMYALKVTPHDHWGQTWTGPDYGLTLQSEGNFSNSSALVSSAINQGTGVTGLAIAPDQSAGMLVPVGVAGISLLPAGGSDNRTYGVFGQASGTGGYGVFGYGTYTGTLGISEGTSGRGIYGEALGSGGTGVYGQGPNGIYGNSTVSNGNGMIAVANTGSLAFGVWGISSQGYAGYFSGNVNVTGNLTKSGGNFRIDHPLDPADMYLNHSFVESPDMKNIYDGVVTLNEFGEATVVLPDWFEALNRDFRYQLTCIGGYAPVYIASEIRDGTFTIAGGTPGLKVSWQVTGIRQDPWANDHRIQVEEQKPPGIAGTYLYPQGYNQPESLASDYSRIQQLLESQQSFEAVENTMDSPLLPPGVWIDWADGSSNQP